MRTSVCACACIRSLKVSDLCTAPALHQRRRSSEHPFPFKTHSRTLLNLFGLIDTNVDHFPRSFAALCTALYVIGIVSISLNHHPPTPDRGVLIVGPRSSYRWYRPSGRTRRLHLRGGVGADERIKGGGWQWGGDYLSIVLINTRSALRCCVFSLRGVDVIAVLKC